MDKLKILIITNLYPPQVIGGYERQMADCAQLLHRRGHTVLVLTSNTKKYTSNNCTNTDSEPVVLRSLYLCGEWTNQGTQWFSFEAIASNTLINRKTLALELQAFKPDICLAGNMDFLGVELIEKILADGIPVAHFVMNPMPGYAAELAPKSKFYQYITCSNWIRQGLKEQGYPVETAHTIHPGAAVEAFYQSELPNRDQLHIVYASLVMPYKGAHVLMEALSLLYIDGINFSATFAGGSLMPEFVQELKEFAESEGMQDKINFTGVLSRQELKELYRTKNVLVLPSCFDEPFSISLVEAMVAGLTVVASNRGGSPEAVEHGQSGLIFESENPLDLADNLFYLPKHPFEWEAMTQQGQQRALSKFGLTTTVEQLESVLFQLAYKSKTFVLN